MTTKEKAEELFSKFYIRAGSKTDSALESASILAEEMIKELGKFERYWKNDVIDPIEYWRKVKTEIENIGVKSLEKNRLKEIVGKWPGNETDEEINNFLKNDR